MGQDTGCQNLARGKKLDGEHAAFGVEIEHDARRDRMWLLNALAIALLTLLGAAGEALGYDRYLKSNTTQRRTHSLFRQGCMLYELISTMPELRLLPLIERFAVMLAELPVFADTFGPL